MKCPLSSGARLNALPAFPPGTTATPTIPSTGTRSGLRTETRTCGAAPFTKPTECFGVSGPCPSSVSAQRTARGLSGNPS